MEGNNWDSLKKYTNARIALGRSGNSIATPALLDFRRAHALARDAVYAPLQDALLISELKNLGTQCLLVHSNAPYRNIYLQRPDLGRSLNEHSTNLLENYTGPQQDIAIILADGLSATAIHNHAIPFLKTLLLKKEWSYKLDVVTIAWQSRVALGDEIGHLLKAKLTVMLIGERPGLSSPDSMGIYMTLLQILA